jgi:hypothetical protein
MYDREEIEQMKAEIQRRRKELALLESQLRQLKKQRKVRRKGDDEDGR